MAPSCSNCLQPADRKAAAAVFAAVAAAAEVHYRFWKTNTRSAAMEPDCTAL